ncbi:hypothetical protein SpCBS45565_g06153 [Spizellomyces sp. 'palustris']|nr:hypothetical protein SpCBS45565_g06153 [Spizellomyces sp. 'palustris']
MAPTTTTSRVFFFDIDNCLYGKSVGIYSEMGKRIHAYFQTLGLPDAEASRLHHKYYTEYGLAVRGLVKHHNVDPIAYDKVVDQSIPLEKYLKHDQELRGMLEGMSGVKKWAFTNAYKVHALRVLELLDIRDQFAGITFCDYTLPDFACKPDPRYYAQAMRDAEISDPSQCYLVDDSAANIDMAQKLGWTTVHITDDPQSLHGDFRIKCVKELPTVLPGFWTRN